MASTLDERQDRLTDKRARLSPSMTSRPLNMTSGITPPHLSSEGTVSLGLVQRFLAYCQSCGLSRQSLLHPTAPMIEGLNDRDARVPLPLYRNLVRAAMTLANDAALPLHFASGADFSEVSIAGLIANASETMADALVQLNRYGRLAIDIPHTGPNRLNLVKTDTAVWIVDTRLAPEQFPELTETTFTYLITGPRRFLPTPHILAAEVTHDRPPHGDVYEEIWQCPIRFGAERNALKVNPDIIYHRVRLQPDYAFGVLCAHADALLADLKAAKTLHGQVEALLLPVLHTGEASIEATAAQMGMSRQTLYRRLKAEGTTFEGVIDSLRHRMAQHYLDAGVTTVAEIGYLLGFSDASAFSRAYKRWTGHSPGYARRSAD